MNQWLRTLHFLSLHLWHAFTTLLLTSRMSRDASGELRDFGERGILWQETMIWAREGLKGWIQTLSRDCIRANVGKGLS